MRFSPLVDRISGKGAAAWNVHFEALRRRGQGQDVILLTVGDPDQAPPSAMVKATVAALERRRTQYSPVVGYPALRAAVAARVARRSGRPCSAENVVIVPGAQAGLYCALQCTAGPGDEVIIPEPIYATYEAVTGASGATLVTVPLHPERRFHPDIDMVERALTPQTRVLWINNPHNPTGAVLSRSEVEALAALCRRHGLWLVSDEVYEDLAFAGPHVTAWGLADQSVIVSSLSKSHAAPGFRIGWIVAPAPLVAHLFNLVLCMLYGGPPFVQDGALAALERDLPEVAALREDYRRRAALLAGMLAAAPGCRVIPPEGGMFVLLDVRGTGQSAEAFARALLEREGVATLPCDGFGPSAIGHLRISLSAADARLIEAGERILRFALALDPANRTEFAEIRDNAVTAARDGKV
jgi:arginine:pyruvate transaminase